MSEQPRIEPPMIEAADLFDRFWNARFDEDDWQSALPDEVYGGCPCGNCRACGMRSALTWTAALLSNPSLADKAEELKAKRQNRSRAKGQSPTTRAAEAAEGNDAEEAL